MERSVLVTCSCLLMAWLYAGLPSTASTSSPLLPRLLRCVFIDRVIVTCWWKPIDTANTNYTLLIWNAARKNPETSPLKCSTTGSNCTVLFPMLTSRGNFCISVTAHNQGGNVSSNLRCQSGRFEVKLSRADLKDLKPVPGHPNCLSVTWKKRPNSGFPVSEQEIKAGELNSQIEFRPQGQLKVRVINVTVKGYQFDVCEFRPNSEYNVRLRHRYKNESSPWSEWSQSLLGRTAEAAPSAAPVFWRQVRERKGSGSRVVSLLWKPLSQSFTNGKIIFYNVTCQTEKSQSINLEGCRNLVKTSFSCSLDLPVDGCSCNLSASTSAGPSPPARLLLPGTSEKVPSRPDHVSVRRLNDSSLEVDWRVSGIHSVSGFVVEWEAVWEKNRSTLHWEKLNPTQTTLIITEGLKPKERYAVSVTVLYGDQQVMGEKATCFEYIQEGAPSVGPNVTADISGSTVKLSWTPVSVEDLHGFLRNYTLYILSPDQQRTKKIIPSDSNHHQLEGLSPGTYKLSMAANTNGGSGPLGREANVHIAFQESWTVAYIILLLVLILMMISLMACMTHAKIMKLAICTDVPDPSNSTLSHWSPKTVETLKHFVVPEQPEMKLSEAVLVCELKAPYPDEDQIYQTAPNIQRHSSVLDSRQLPKASEDTMFSDPSVRHTVYSNVLFSQPVQTLASPLEPSSYDPSCRQTTASFNLSPEAEHETCRSPYQIHSPNSLPNYNCSPHSSLLASETADDCLFQHATNFKEPFPSFSSSIFVDFSYCPLECDPYILSES